MNLEATVEEIHGTIYPHPTYGEAVSGEAIHI
jgi:pyruvate/2-oxoglutarate dehydrogenase complex dihydrolipoamide dehydrogenase (E3) component